MSNYSTLMLPILKEILINEIGEANITPLNWKQVSQNKYKFLADINDFTEVVNVDFELINDEISKHFYLPPKYRNIDKFYNIAYKVSGDENQFTKTNTKTLLQILSTIVDIVKNFTSENSPNILRIEASEKNIGKGDKSQKMNLYKAYIRKNLENTKYNTTLSKGGVLIISKEI